jgi:ABC-type nitrate/sulfonate/bicarbonate transport system substrate-binding protein
VLRPIVYGMPTEKSAPTVQYGIHKGFFRDEGISLSTKALYGGPAIASALNTGQLAFGHLGTPPAIVAHGQGARFRLVGSGVKQKAHLYLGVKAGVSEYQGLRGAKFGLLSMGSCDEWIARRILATHGVGHQEVRFVPIGERYDRITELFAEHAIDAALAIEPNMSVAEHAGVLRIWAAAYEEAYLPVFQWTVLAASDELIDSDPDLLRALLRAYVRSSCAARDGIDEYAAFVAENFSLPLAAARRSIDREMGHYAFDGRIDAEGLRKALELQVSLGAVQAPISMQAMVNEDFVPHATH